MGEQFQEWYYVLQRSRYRRHMAEYYTIYINGSRCNQSEPVLPEVLVMDFGINNTHCRRLIRSVLEHVGKQEI